jgi:hypothetical protein
LIKRIKEVTSAFLKGFPKANSGHLNEFSKSDANSNEKSGKIAQAVFENPFVAALAAYSKISRK